uniref:tRNA_int_endo_N domain-containing protein n=1 Tax=Macrostomum lignano TaxID=282301 RepID=A0A1I8FQH9_9PLAT
MSRRRLMKQLSCVSENVEDDKQVKELKLNPGSEKHNKLWHTPFYDNELKLKQMYVKLCKKFAQLQRCKIYQVKEIQRGNLQRSKAVSLGISEEKDCAAGQQEQGLIRSQPVFRAAPLALGKFLPLTCVELDFQSCKPWNLVLLKRGRAAVNCRLALWEVLECDGIMVRRNSLEFDLHRRNVMLRCDIEAGIVHSNELEELQTLIHFPEEVAIILTDSEHGLFLTVPPQAYLRNVTFDLAKLGYAGCPGEKTVKDLIPSHEERRCCSIPSCALP